MPAAGGVGRPHRHETTHPLVPCLRGLATQAARGRGRKPGQPPAGMDLSRAAAGTAARGHGFKPAAGVDGSCRHGCTGYAGMALRSCLWAAGTDRPRKRGSASPPGRVGCGSRRRHSRTHTSRQPPSHPGPGFPCPAPLFPCPGPVFHVRRPAFPCPALVFKP